MAFGPASSPQSQPPHLFREDEFEEERRRAGEEEEEGEEAEALERELFPMYDPTDPKRPRESLRSYLMRRWDPRNLYRDLQRKSYPYGPPPPPRSYVFAGSGWAFGLGCSFGGPFFGVGAGYSLLGGGGGGGGGNALISLLPHPVVVFGAGGGVGAVCGVGFGSGMVAGVGTGFVPIGFWAAFQFAPRFLGLEIAVEDWLEERAMVRTAKRRAAAARKRRREADRQARPPPPLRWLARRWRALWPGRPQTPISPKDEVLHPPRVPAR